jgi:hypothetical protein
MTGMTHIDRCHGAALAAALCLLTVSPRFVSCDPMKTTMQRVGMCPAAVACGGGSVGVRVSSSGSCVAAMCDECDAIWWDSRMTDGPHFLEQPHLPCPIDGSSLREGHWATLDEVATIGWRDAVIEEAEALR